MNKPTTRIALEVIQRRAQWQVAHIRDFKARNETPGDVTDAGADGREGFLPPDFRKRLGECLFESEPRIEGERIVDELRRDFPDIEAHDIDVGTKMNERNLRGLECCEVRRVKRDCVPDEVRL